MSLVLDMIRHKGIIYQERFPAIFMIYKMDGDGAAKRSLSLLLDTQRPTACSDGCNYI